ncbi:MAG: lysophospholipase [Candidatus Thermoplasmatota archaeon]|nr:lysophospholipase [Candidatus Thermoplasmatota archaeon]
MRKVAILACLAVGLMIATAFSGCVDLQNPLESLKSLVGGKDESAVITGDGFFVGQENASIYYRYWKVENPIAIVIIVHGYGEHCGRYDWVARNFCAHGISCYALDHRGHGHSSGPRWNCEDYNYWIEDLHTFSKMVKPIEGDKKYFMLGHSMGGGIAAGYAEKYPNDMVAYVLSGAMVGSSGPQTQILDGARPLIDVAEPLLSDYAVPVGLSGSSLNHDENNTKAYDNDPMVCHGQMKVRMVAEMGQLEAYDQENIGQISAPCLFVHGSDDQLVNHNDTMAFYENLSIQDKKFITYDGFYHEVLNEPEWFHGGKVRVMNDIYGWLMPRI